MSDEERKDIDISEEANATQEPEAPPEVPAQAPPAAPSAPTPVPAASGYVPGEQKKGLAEQFRIIKERRLLRKDLKAKGITSRKDFKIIAESLGLVGWKASPFLIWLHHAMTAFAAGLGLKSLVAASAALLAGMFLISTISEEKGSFTINLTGDMLQAGFVLSNTADFDEETSRLFSEKLEQVNNITIEDIDKEVDNIDGPHNGDHYVAYTFYIKNTSDIPADYAWYLKMTDEMLGVSKAVWAMVFEDGYQVTYTRPSAENTPEELYGFTSPLAFSDKAYDAEKQYYEKPDENGKTKYGIVTTPYADDEIVAQGLVSDVQPGDVHKYTVVLWIEGHDPDCTDEIFGGFAKFKMEFENVTEKDKGSIFDGVFRTEYDQIPDIGDNTEDTGDETGE